MTAEFFLLQRDRTFTYHNHYFNKTTLLHHPWATGDLWLPTPVFNGDQKISSQSISPLLTGFIAGKLKLVFLIPYYQIINASFKFPHQRPRVLTKKIIALTNHHIIKNTKFNQISGGFFVLLTI
jgi:hypothetical protein